MCDLSLTNNINLVSLNMITNSTAIDYLLAREYGVNFKQNIYFNDILEMGYHLTYDQLSSLSTLKGDENRVLSLYRPCDGDPLETRLILVGEYMQTCIELHSLDLTNSFTSIPERWNGEASKLYDINSPINSYFHFNSEDKSWVLKQERYHLADTEIWEFNFPNEMFWQDNCTYNETYTVTHYSL